MNRFTEDQIREYNDTFSLFDRNNRGFIRNCQLREMLRLVGLNPTDKLLEELSIMCDVDEDNVIIFEEFVDIIDKLETEEIGRKDAQDEFNAFDFLGEGYVMAIDIKEALLYVMETISEIDKTEVLRYFKLEKNRKIDFDEFYDMITIQRYEDCPKEFEIYRPDIEQT